MKNSDRLEGTTGNSRLPQWGLTWLIEVQCFYQHLCSVDSEVLRNSPQRQAAKRQTVSKPLIPVDKKYTIA